MKCRPQRTAMRLRKLNQFRPLCVSGGGERDQLGGELVPVAGRRLAVPEEVSGVIAAPHDTETPRGRIAIINEA